jgi:putative DNA primase/helicase
MSNKDETQTNKSNLIEVPIDVWTDLRNKTLEYTQKEVDRAMQQDQELQDMKDGEPTSLFLEFEEDEKTGKVKVKYDHVGQAKEIIRELKILNNKFGMYYYNKKTGLWGQDTIPVVRSLINKKLGRYATISRINETLQAINGCYEENVAAVPFDLQVNLIGFKNGVYDITTKRFRDYRPTDYLMTQVPHNYNPSANFSGSKSDRYLTKLLGKKKQFFLEWLGYTFYRDYCFQHLLILKGNGQNGKSKLIEWYEHIVGGFNVTNVPLKELQENRFALSDLKGKMANMFADISDDHFRYSDIIKTLTGNDWISCDVKNGARVRYKNYAKLTFSCNTLPSFRDKTDGNIRRFIIMPMMDKIEPSKVNFLDHLFTQEEVEGSIMAALHAFERVMETKEFSITEEMNNAKADWLENMDYVRSFVVNECEMKQDSFIDRDICYHKYKQYCEASETSPMGRNKFCEHLQHLFPNVQYGRGKMNDYGKRPYGFKGLNFIGG